MTWEVFIDNLETIYECLDSMGMEFIYLNMAMILPMINDKDTIIEKTEHSIFFRVKWQSWCLVPISKDRQSFFKDILFYLKKHWEVKHIPMIFAEKLRSIASVKTFQKEHIIRTDVLIKMEWWALADRRYEKNRFLKGKNWDYSIVELSQSNKELFLECNRVWYKRQSEIYFLH